MYLTPSHKSQDSHQFASVIMQWLSSSSSNEMFRPRRWNYCKLNTAKLTALAEELNWRETTRDDIVKTQWANIKNVVLSLRDKTVP